MRCLLGHDAIADRKLEFGNPLTILGVATQLVQDGVRFSADPAKLVKWAKQIETALTSGRLTAGESSKLAGARLCVLLAAGACVSFAGRLMWASQCTFKRVGRAFLYPLFRQQNSRRSSISRELFLALRWWHEALSLQLCELRLWRPLASKTRHLLCDARSTPPRVAAVLMFDGRVFYSDMEPSREVVSCLHSDCLGVSAYSLVGVGFLSQAARLPDHEP